MKKENTDFIVEIKESNDYIAIFVTRKSDIKTELVTIRKNEKLQIENVKAMITLLTRIEI